MTISMFKRRPVARRATVATALSALFALGMFVMLVGGAQAVTPPTVLLGTADSFSILAYTGVSDVPPSPIFGDVGVSPTAGSSITGLTCAEVTGTIYSVDATGPLPCRVTNPALLTTAKNDLTTAFLNAAGRTPDTTFVAADNQLGTQNLVAGVYRIPHATTANLIGNLTLTGSASDVWIFQATSDLVTASSSTVTLSGGAQACNVFWQVGSSATLGSSSSFVGTILALTSVFVNTSATINGRLLAQNGAVTLDHNTITRSSCAPIPGPPEETTAAATTTTTAATTTAAATTTTTAAVTTTPVIRKPTALATPKKAAPAKKVAAAKKVKVVKKVTVVKKKAATSTNKAHALPARAHAGFTG